MTRASTLALLQAMDIVFEDGDEIDHYAQTLNMNDVWGWATAWGEYIPDEELPRVGDLLNRYGWCGALYWMSERHAQMRSEFEDINRFVEFVRREEQIRKDSPGSSARAYKKVCYAIGFPLDTTPQKETPE